MTMVIILILMKMMNDTKTTGVASSFQADTIISPTVNDDSKNIEFFH